MRKEHMMKSYNRVGILCFLMITGSLHSSNKYNPKKSNAPYWRAFILEEYARECARSDDFVISEKNALNVSRETMALYSLRHLPNNSFIRKIAPELEIFSFDHSPQAQLYAACFWSGIINDYSKVQIWKDTLTYAQAVEKNQLYNLTDVEAWPSKVLALTFSPCGKYLYTGDLGGNVNITSIERTSRVCKRVSFGEKNGVISLRCSLDGSHIFAKLRDNSWNIIQKVPKQVSPVVALPPPAPVPQQTTHKRRKISRRHGIDIED
jgi:hypothetical protein